MTVTEGSETAQEPGEQGGAAVSTVYILESDWNRRLQCRLSLPSTGQRALCYFGAGSSEGTGQEPRTRGW